MGARIGLVAILVEHNIAIIAAGQFLSHANCAIAAEFAIGENNLRAVEFEHLAALLRHIIGHNSSKAVALDASNHGQGDTGIAAGWFQEDRTGRKFTSGLSLLDHLFGDAILDAAGGIDSLQLGKNLHALTWTEAT